MKKEVTINQLSNDIQIGYSTNVHPAWTLDEVLTLLADCASKVRQLYIPNNILGIDLHLGMDVIDTCATEPGKCERLGEVLKEVGLRAFTVNGFPLGRFHAERVKESVYRPSWTEEARQRYTCLLGRIMTTWMDEGDTATLSTLAGAFREQEDGTQAKNKMAHELARCAGFLWELQEETGRRVELCLEPEPFTTIATTEDAVHFFQDFLLREGASYLEKRMGSARVEEILRKMIGINYDTCHQAVMFEDPVRSLETLESAGIAVKKVHIASALSLVEPSKHPECLAALNRFDEPRYLHQTFGCNHQGRVVLEAKDLGQIPQNTGDLSQIAELRAHFHVPVYMDACGPLQTTQAWTQKALAWIMAKGTCRHFAVETYTWEVLQQFGMKDIEQSLEEGIARELQWAHKALLTTAK